MVFTYMCVLLICTLVSCGSQNPGRTKGTCTHTYTHIRRVQTKKKSNLKWCEKPYEIFCVARSVSYQEIPLYPAQKKDIQEQQEEHAWGDFTENYTVLRDQVSHWKRNQTTSMHGLGRTTGSQMKEHWKKNLPNSQHTVDDFRKYQLRQITSHCTPTNKTLGKWVGGEFSNRLLLP